MLKLLLPTSETSLNDGTQNYSHPVIPVIVIYQENLLPNFCVRSNLTLRAKRFNISSI
jgi:hypothetical protein